MKRNLFIISLLTVIFGISACLPPKLVRLTIINKSTFDLEIGLTGQEYEQMYTLRVPEGDKDSPEEKVFTIVPDVYRFIPYYVEYWDPVYGRQCNTVPSIKDLTRQTQIIMFHCNDMIRKPGEKTHMKYPAVWFKFRF